MLANDYKGGGDFPQMMQHLLVSAACVCDSDELLKVLNRFYKRKEMQKLAADSGLDGEERVCQFSHGRPQASDHMPERDFLCLITLFIC